MFYLKWKLTYFNKIIENIWTVIVLIRVSLKLNSTGILLILISRKAIFFNLKNLMAKKTIEQLQLELLNFLIILLNDKPKDDCWT